MNIETVIAVNRFGLGAKPGEPARAEGRHRRWLLDQLAGPSRAPAAFADMAATPAILVEVEALRDLRRKMRQAGENDPDVVKQYSVAVRRHYLQQVGARYGHATETDYPFHERLVHFWTNHFAVSADKQPLPAIAGTFENEAIRPHIGGRFIDLLLAVERHPAMLIYLDNQQSVGPNSSLAKRANARRPDRQLGLNENLAREILELHTLGVDGGYTQDDVTRFAKALTGWSVGGGRNWRFRSGETGTF